MTWQSKNKFARGHNRPAGGVKRPGFHLIAHALTSSLTGKSLTTSAPTPFDQGGEGSCGGHGYAGAVTTAFAAQGKPLSFVCSPADIYKNNRCIYRTPNADGTFPALTDSGSDPDALCDAISQWGVRAIGPNVQDPGDPAPRYSDCSLANCNTEPVLADLEADATHIVIGEYAISPATPQALATALDNNMPFPLSVPGGSDAWQEYTGGVVTAVPAEQAELDHEVFCLGYRVNTMTGKFEFEIRNSWGASYGESGNLWIDEAAMAQCADQRAMKVSLA